MLKTIITNPTGSSSFSYVVDSENAIGNQNGTTKSTTMESLLTMYIIGTDSTSVSFDADPPSKYTGNVNPYYADQVNNKTIYGTIEVQLANSALATENSSPVYFELTRTGGGTLPAGFRIKQIGTRVYPYLGNEYVLGDPVQVADAIAPDTDNTIVTILVEYTGSSTGVTCGLTLAGYEYYNTTEYPLSSTPSITITTVFAILTPTVTLVNDDNSGRGNTVGVNIGESIYYLTTIVNSGNIATLANTVFSQTIMAAHLTGTTVEYGPTVPVDPTIPANWAHSESITGNLVTITIPETIAATNGTYYVRVIATVV